MNIAIDCFKLVKGAGKSIGIYNLAHNLVRNLVRYKPSESVTIFVFGTDRNREDFEIPGVNFIEIKKYDPLNKIHAVLWELFFVSSLCRKYKIDRVIFPRGYCALIHPCYDIIIIHDLIPFYYDENYPGYFNRFENTYIMNRLRGSARSCKKIITISDFSKGDILSRFGINENKISVIYNGVNDIWVPSETMTDDYICAITSTMPHKNASGIMAAYKAYFNKAADPLRLVIIGIESVSDYPDAADLSEFVTCYKFIKEDSKMHEIIGNSRAFLFLSLIEGFGFPPIEAMQLGVPVICSDTSSLPEIVNDSALLVNPGSPEDVADAIMKVTTDSELASGIIESGRKNVQRFSWEKQAGLYWDEILGA